MLFKITAASEIHRTGCPILVQPVPSWATSIVCDKLQHKRRWHVTVKNEIQTNFYKLVYCVTNPGYAAGSLGLFCTESWRRIRGAWQLCKPLRLTSRKCCSASRAKCVPLYAERFADDFDKPGSHLNAGECGDESTTDA